MKKILLTLTFLLGIISIANATSGGTDSSGCHNDYKGGTGYHCHNGFGNPSYDLVVNGRIIGRYNSLKQCESAKRYVARKYNKFGYCKLS